MSACLCHWFLRRRIEPLVGGRINVATVVICLEVEEVLLAAWDFAWNVWISWMGVEFCRRQFPIVRSNSVPST